MLFSRMSPHTVLRPTWSKTSQHLIATPLPPKHSPLFHPYDVCVHAFNALQTPITGAHSDQPPLPRFNGRRISVWWDFDNLSPCGGVGAAVIMAHRITVCTCHRPDMSNTPSTQRAVLQHGGSLQHVRVYGNELTMTKHHLSMRLLAGFGATAVCVGNKKCVVVAPGVSQQFLLASLWWHRQVRTAGPHQHIHTNTMVTTLREAADMAIMSDVYWWAQQAGSEGVVVLISSDHGFAQLLTLARSQGCATVAVGLFERSRGGRAARLPRQVC